MKNRASVTTPRSLFLSTLPMKTPNLTHSAFCFIVSALFLVIGSCNSLLAVGTASVSGQVTVAGTDPAYPVSGMTLTLVGDGPQLISVTDANGNYSFTGLNAGKNGLKIKIRDTLYLDLNKDLGALPSSNSIVNIQLVPRLTLSALCSVNPSVSRHWNVHNPLPVPVSFEWVLKHPSNQTGSG